MKKILFISTFFIAYSAFAQTNTFPANGNVGIGTLSPTTKLMVIGDGTFTGTFGGRGGQYNVLHISPLNNAPSHFYINTHIPAADYAAPQIHITGYMYSNSNKALKLTIGWYHYQNNFYWAQYQSDLGYAKPSRIRLGKYVENGSTYIRIELSNESVYWSNYTISATDYNGNNGSYVNWTYGEGEMPSNTFEIINVSHQADVLIDGKIGVGIATPSTPLHVNGGSIMTHGWNRTATLQATFPVQVFNSNNNKWAGIGYDYTTAMRFWVNSSNDDVAGNGIAALNILNNGNTGIGITNPTEKLSVNGNIRAKKLIVTQQNWSDYVFYKGYKLRPLTEIEKYIKQHQHLPDMPSAKEVQANGISVGDTQALLLKKIEELTLYIIELKKENLIQEVAISKMYKEIMKFKNK